MHAKPYVGLRVRLGDRVGIVESIVSVERRDLPGGKVVEVWEINTRCEVRSEA